MLLSTGSSKLSFALKTLRLHWEETKTEWNDRARRDFEDKQLAPIETQVSATLTGINSLAQVLAKAQQECA